MSSLSWTLYSMLFLFRNLNIPTTLLSLCHRRWKEGSEEFIDLSKDDVLGGDGGRSQCGADFTPELFPMVSTCTHSHWPYGPLHVPWKWAPWTWRLLDLYLSALSTLTAESESEGLLLLKFICMSMLCTHLSSHSWPPPSAPSTIKASLQIFPPTTLRSSSSQ